MARKYAVGSGVRLRAAKETTSGVLASSGWRYFDAVSFGLSGDRAVNDRVLLGQGRNTGEPTLGRKTFTGPMVVPMDARNTGFWFLSLLGNPTTTSVKATGYISFSGQPAADSTINLNGTVWTFKASGASGPQTDIGVDLDATLTALASDLNGSADTQVAKCTYTANTDDGRLEIEYDTAGTAGNAFTIDASTTSNGTTSANNLQTGGYKHVWLTGQEDLETLSIERGFPGLTDPTFSRFTKVSIGEYSFQIELEGDLNANLTMMAQDQTYAGLTVEDDPDIIPLDIFEQRRAWISIGSTALSAAVTTGNLNFSNNLDPLFLRSLDSRMEEAQPTNVTLTGSATWRLHGNDPLAELADSGDWVEITYGNRTENGWTMDWRMPRCKLGLAKVGLDGPGGVDTTSDWVAGLDPDIEAKAEVTLINDVASY